MGIDVGLVFSCAGIFYAPVSSSLGVEIGQFGLYMSISYIASSLMLPLAGRMIERYGSRRLLTINSLLLGLTVAAMGLSTALWQFYLEGVVMGVTLAFLLYLSFPILVNAWFRTKIGLMIGICSAASGIGGMIFNPIGGAIISAWGWRAAYLTFGALIGLVVSPVIGLLLRNHPSEKGLEPYGADKMPEKKAEAPAVSEGVEFGRAVRMPAFYCAILFAFIMMAVSTLNLFIPKYTLLNGFNEIQASLAAAAVMAGVTTGKLLLGMINDRNVLWGTLATTLLGLLGLIVLLTLPAHLWALLAGCFLFGWEYAGVTVQTAMLTSHAFGRLHYTRIYAMVSIALAAGGAVASGGWGLLADATSYATAFTVGAVTLAIGALLGITVYASRR